MGPSSEMAERAVDSSWREGHVRALVDATPMRAGRGRPAGGPNLKGRRPERRRGELTRFDAMVFALEAGLRSGSIDLEAARRAVSEAGFDDFVRVAGSRREAVEAFAHFFGLGYFLWSVGEGPDGGDGGLLRARFATREELT